MCAYAERGQSLMLHVSLSSSSALLFWDRVSHWTGKSLICLGQWLASKLPSGDVHMPPCPTLMWVLGMRTRVFMLMWEALYSLSHLSSCFLIEHFLFYFSGVLFHFVLETAFLCHVALAVLEFLCRSGWPQIYRNLPTSASWVLGLKECDTNPSLKSGIICLKKHLSM